MEQRRQKVVLIPDDDHAVPKPRSSHHWQAGTPALCTVQTLWEHAWRRDHPDDDVQIPADLGHREHDPQHAQEVT